MPPKCSREHAHPLGNDSRLHSRQHVRRLLLASRLLVDGALDTAFSPRFLTSFVDRRGLHLALLPAALACPLAATLILAVSPGTESTRTAAGMAALVLLSIVLAGLALRYPNARTPLSLRLFLVALAIIQGAQVAWANWQLALDHDTIPLASPFAALAAFAYLGVVLAALHFALYRTPRPHPAFA